jgi:shikimate kinase
MMTEAYIKKNAANIVLVGMMGVGKTAVGRMLAEQLAYDFVDLDAEMEQVCGLKLSEIYKKYGKIRFYSEEKLLLEKQVGSSGRVIAAGGALTPLPEQISLWQRLGVVVWLQAEPETILRRMKRKQNRLFLPNRATVQDVANIIEERRESYNSAADYQINVDSCALEQVVAGIAEFYGRLFVK